jgi:hypothetical protein
VRGDLRFGERLPNPFAEGDLTHWFHLRCAAYKRPEPFLETLTETTDTLSERVQLDQITRHTIAHRRLSRIDGGERAPGSQAKCRHCHESIERGTWRIRLVFYEEGRFTPAGFVHTKCGTAYFETANIADQVLHFSTDLSDDEREKLRDALRETSSTP